MNETLSLYQDVPSQIGIELYEDVLEDDAGGKCDIDEVRLAFKTITRLSVIVHTHPYLQIISAT